MAKQRTGFEENAVNHSKSLSFLGQVQRPIILHRCSAWRKITTQNYQTSFICSYGCPFPHQNPEFTLVLFPCANTPGAQRPEPVLPDVGTNDYSQTKLPLWGNDSLVKMGWWVGFRWFGIWSLALLRQLTGSLS